MIVEIDPHAGFCFGVEKAIERAQVRLARDNALYCLGEIVHNPEEIRRLAEMGLKTLDPEEFKHLRNSTVLIRAHGEPPETYKIAEENNITLVEATCPIVTRLQKKVRDAWDEVKEQKGVVVIAGRKNHPEVVGLAGQTGHQALVIESADEIDTLDLSRPIRLFAQTTFDRQEFEKIRTGLMERIQGNGYHTGQLKSFNTICGQVSNRIPKLKAFCKSHDVIVFVSGKNSSNGKQLFAICKEVNPSSFHISTPEEFDPGWIRGAERVGISGATSTPQWLMEKIANKIEQG